MPTPEPLPEVRSRTVEKPDHLALARDLMEKGYYEVALGQLDAIEGTSAMAERHYLRAVCLRETGDLEGARIHFAKSLSRDADYAPALGGLALTWDLAKAAEKAWPLYRRAIALNPARADLFNNYGYSLMTAGRLEEARIQFEKSHSLDPEAPKVINNLALCALLDGRKAAAAELMMKIAPTAEAHYRAGALAQRAGQDEVAVQFYRRALEIDPQLETARRHLETLAGAPAAP
jgi:Tfp pilus assembly protein PilF